MIKDFDKWNKLKQQLEATDRKIYANQREIWWCHLGINLGSEVCGKNDPFERPVIILKVFNKNLLLIAPLSTKKKDSINHIEFKSDFGVSYILVEHIKTISNKRLSRKISKVGKNEFIDIYSKIKSLL